MSENPRATATPHSLPSQSLAWRASELNRALALVRPVSMTDETASDWLAAAIAETAELSDAAFGAAVAKARKTCTYHGQIIPAIAAEAPSPSRDPFAWALACHNPSVQSLAGPNSEPKRIGDIVKRIGRE